MPRITNLTFTKDYKTVAEGWLSLSELFRLFTEEMIRQRRIQEGLRQ